MGSQGKTKWDKTRKTRFYLRLSRLCSLLGPRNTRGPYLDRGPIKGMILNSLRLELRAQGGGFEVLKLDCNVT